MKTSFLDYFTKHKDPINLVGESFFCVFCNKKVIFNDFGDPIRKNIACSVCNSLERHRFLYYIYQILFLGSSNKINLLHMAPEKCLYDILVSNKNIDYVSADFEPANFGFLSCDKQDFTKMSYEDKKFDVVLSNQVLEHIKDEQKCLSEINRVLKDDGIAIINIPYSPNLAETFEDDNIINDEDRKRVYGQNDHVRLYGSDASQRFEKSGFIVNQIRAGIFPKEFIDYCKLEHNNLITIDPGGYFILRKKL